VWLCALLTGASPADFAAGKKAYDQGDYTRAVREWQAAASQGDAAAQYWLGALYESGRGVDKDELVGRQLELEAAERGYEYAQNALGWPIKPENRPSLTCGPNPPSVAGALEKEAPFRADSIKGFQFRVTLHNARPPLERPITSAENVSPKRQGANVSIAVYRIENDRRVDVPHPLAEWGGGIDNPRGAITDQFVLASVRIPVEGAERSLYIEQFLALLSRSPNQTPERVQQTRQLMLHSDRPDEASYMDNMMPNRLGLYEIVCRYQSERPGYWNEVLVAPAFRFEYVKTMDWIQIFNRKDPPK
jgi:hypothetical protein